MHLDVIYLHVRFGWGQRLTAGKSILEDLLETQELEDRQVDGRVQTETALVRTEGRVELHSVTAVDLDLVLVVFPDNSELDDALGDGGNLEGFFVFWVLLEEGRVLEGGGQLWRGVSLVSLRRRGGGVFSGAGSLLEILQTRHDPAAGRPRLQLCGELLTLVGLLELWLGRKVRHDCVCSCSCIYELVSSGRGIS